MISDFTQAVFKDTMICGLVLEVCARRPRLGSARVIG
jgi:hypothetical protein